MADLELAHGPWKRIISATWGTYPIQIYQNPDKVLLIALFEKKDDEITGVLVLERRALLLEGDATNYSLTQKREMSLVEKITREDRYKYLIVDSTPAFIPYTEADLSNEVSKQYEELDALVKLTKKGLESSGDVKAKELKHATEEEVQNLLGDPISILSFSKKGVLVKEAHEGHATSAASVLLGMDREGEKVEANLKSVFSSAILGDNTGKRHHLMHILTEAALINNVPCIVFDSEGAFTGLAVPNKHKADLDKYSMKSLPIGFPFKQYEVGKSLFVDLSLIDAELFLSSFNLEKSDIAPLIKKVYEDHQDKLSVLGDIISELSDVKEGKELSRFLILRAIRIMSVLQKTHPQLFGKNISEELSAPWKDGLGKVIYIPLPKEEAEVSRLIINSIIRTVSASPFSSNSVLFVFEPTPEVLKEEILKQISEFPKQGKGFVVNAYQETDSPAFQEPLLKLELVTNEVIVSEKNANKKRFEPRPAYSTCSEFETAPPEEKKEKK